MPVMPGAYVVGPKTVQNAVSATGNGTAIDVITNSGGSFSVAVFHVTGTFSATVGFEGTIDGSNWFDIEVEDLSDSTSRATSVTAAGAHRAIVMGLRQVRAPVTWTSGTSVTVKVNLVA